mmetsp:Transcript_32986/g.105057  ORF Transcript_32986/g.105057 Transcript_32986/m.105057 type:complete len:222 (+) Transcript_32986:1475-2140(+)
MVGPRLPTGLLPPRRRTWTAVRLAACTYLLGVYFYLPSGLPGYREANGGPGLVGLHGDPRQDEAASLALLYGTRGVEEEDLLFQRQSMREEDESTSSRAHGGRCRYEGCAGASWAVGRGTGGGREVLLPPGGSFPVRGRGGDRLQPSAGRLLRLRRRERRAWHLSVRRAWWAFFLPIRCPVDPRESRGGRASGLRRWGGRVGQEGAGTSTDAFLSPRAGRA